MLFVITGDYIAQRKNYSDKLLLTLQTKRPDATVFSFDPDNVELWRLQEQLFGLGLFENKSITKLNAVMENKAVSDWIKDNLTALHESDNAFILIETKLPKPTQTKFEKAGIEIKAFDPPATSASQPAPNMFAAGDYLLERNAKKLWLFWQDLAHQGSAVEELLGILCWQLKVLNLSYTYNQADSGQKPFGYNKAAKAQAKWTATEARTAYADLIGLYHQARRGQRDLGKGFEKFLLGI